MIGCVVRQIVNWSDKTIVCLERYSYKVRWNNKYVENKWFSVINYCYNDYIFYCQNVSILPWFLRFFKLDFRTVPMVLWILFFIMISFYINKRAFVNKYVINHHASLVTLGLLSEKWIVLLTLFEFKIFYMRVSILNTCEQHFISLRREVWAHKTSLTCTKPGELEIIYMCVTVFHFAAVFFSFDSPIEFWNCSDSVLFCVILLLCNHYNWDMNDYTSSVSLPQAQTYQ